MHKSGGFSGNILVLALQVQAGDKNRILQKMLTHFGERSIAQNTWNAFLCLGGRILIR